MICPITQTGLFKDLYSPANRITSKQALTSGYYIRSFKHFFNSALFSPLMWFALYSNQNYIFISVIIVDFSPQKNTCNSIGLFSTEEVVLPVIGKKCKQNIQVCQQFPIFHYLIFTCSLMVYTFITFSFSAIS